jgi:hypothetical protein
MDPELFGHKPFFCNAVLEFEEVSWTKAYIT